MYFWSVMKKKLKMKKNNNNNKSVYGIFPMLWK